MHRFGRTTQLKDRWGGSFILATILALVGAYFAGNKLSDWFGNRAVNNDSSGYTDVGGLGNDQSHTVNMAVAPQQFQVHFVQVAAVRSEASAKKLAKDLTEKSYTAMVGAKTSAGVYPVMVGLYSDSKAAQDAKATLVSEGMKESFVVTKMVDVNTGVVPASAMGGTTSVDIKKGIDTMNVYLHQVALWAENRAVGSIDTTAMTDHGKQLGEIAAAMKDVTDAKAKQFADLAMKASLNAQAMQKAAKAQPSSQEFQAAMSGYIGLLDGYRTFQSSK